MKRDWTQDELIEHWTLAPSELVLLMNKSGPGRLGFATLLKFFQTEARFPSANYDVPVAAVEYLASRRKPPPQPGPNTTGRAARSSIIAPRFGRSGVFAKLRPRTGKP